MEPGIFFRAEESFRFSEDSLFGGVEPRRSSVLSACAEGKRGGCAENESDTGVESE